MTPKLSRRELTAAFAALLSSCAGTPRKSYQQVRALYAFEAQGVRDLVRSLIAVPGIMGSELAHRDSREVAWGRWRFDLAYAGTHVGAADVPVLSLPMEPGRPLAELKDDLVPTGILHYVELDLPTGPLWVNAYAGAFAGLLRQVVNVDDAGPVVLAHQDFQQQPFFGFSYDWRRDLTEAVVALDGVVREAARLRGGKVPVLAHSMGSLVVRYYLRYGTAPLPADGSLPPLTWAGAQHIGTALFAGPPNAGSVLALVGLLEGQTLNPILPLYPPAVLATMPSSYELMPRVRHGLLRWADTHEPIDFTDVSLWQRLELGPFAPEADADLRLQLPGLATRAQRVETMAEHMHKCFARAGQLHAALDRPARPPPELRYHVLVGDALPTPAVYELDRVTRRVSLKETWPGDGTVTRASALLDERMGGASRVHPYDSPFEPTAVRFLDQEHQALLDAPAVLDELLFLALR